MISKGDRVQHKVNGKLGTATQAEYMSFDGRSRILVKWDSSTRPAAACLVSNLKPADA